MPPEGLPASQHLTLFNHPEFHRLNLAPGQRIVRFDHHEGDRLVGTFTGVVVGDELVSGHSAPFGGPDLVRESETATAVVALLEDTLAQAEAEGIGTVRVKARPDFYSASEQAMQFAFLNLGFAVEACELNFHLDLSGLATVDDYVAQLKPPARRALKHAAGEPFALSEAASEDEWAVGYGILDRNRRAKGRSLRLSLEYIRRVRDAFPRQIRMFNLTHDGQPCAAALVYRVRPRRDLVVYWGDADHALRRSPMNVLVQGLVGVAIEGGAQSIDVGTSSVAGVPDQGLIQFKESVGARPRLRLNLVTQL